MSENRLKLLELIDLLTLHQIMAPPPPCKPTNLDLSIIAHSPDSVLNIRKDNVSCSLYNWIDQQLLNILGFFIWT